MADLPPGPEPAEGLGKDFALAEIHKLYECHGFLLEHKAALFTHLQTRCGCPERSRMGKDLFNARFEVLPFGGLRALSPSINSGP